MNDHGNGYTGTQMSSDCPLVVLDTANRTIYVKGRADVRVPSGWTLKDIKDFTPAIKAALALRNSGFMSSDKKIPGIKLIRAVTGVGLAEAKTAFETVLAWDSDVVNNVAYAA